MQPDVLLASPQEFFSRALDDAMYKERVEIGWNARSYVLRLLLDQIDRGYHPDETLSDRFVRALEARYPDRILRLREVGDRALIVSGLWWEHQYRPLRASHAGLHMELGRMAYDALGGDPFGELAANIGGVVDALIRFGTDRSLTTARDILRLYMLWQETHSRHAAHALSQRGITVVCSRQSVPQ